MDTPRPGSQENQDNRTGYCTQRVSEPPVLCFGRMRYAASAVVIFSMDRMAMLNEILSQNPNDAFARYGLAMEYSNAGEVENAMEEFRKLLTSHPDYTAGYFMAAQTLAKVARAEEAKKMLREGIASATRSGTGHALSEMEGMLAELE
jgi:predicted Zn-dependent protease